MLLDAIAEMTRILPGHQKTTAGNPVQNYTPTHPEVLNIRTRLPPQIVPAQIVTSFWMRFSPPILMALWYHSEGYISSHFKVIYDYNPRLFPPPSPSIPHPVP